MDKTLNTNDLIGKPFSDDPALAYGPDFYSCYGLLCEVYRRCGIELYRTNIAVTACRQASDREIRAHMSDWIKIDKPQVPCGVLIRSVNPEFADHIGIYIGGGLMLHTTMNTHAVVDRVDTFKHKIIGFYQYAGYHHHDS